MEIGIQRLWVQLLKPHLIVSCSLEWIALTICCVCHAWRDAFSEPFWKLQLIAHFPGGTWKKVAGAWSYRALYVHSFVRLSKAERGLFWVLFDGNCPLVAHVKKRRIARVAEFMVKKVPKSEGEHSLRMVPMYFPDAESEVLVIRNRAPKVTVYVWLSPRLPEHLPKLSNGTMPSRADFPWYLSQMRKGPLKMSSRENKLCSFFPKDGWLKVGLRY